MALGTIQKRITLLGVLLALLAIVDVWASAAVATARDRSLRASEVTERCRILAAEITQLRERPDLAAPQELAANELAGKIERAAKDAGIQAASIIRIYPEPAHRIGDTKYLEKSTQLHFQRITMQQLFTCLHALIKNGTGLNVSSVRLAVPRDRDGGGEWNVQTTISYLIYSPKLTDTGGKP